MKLSNKLSILYYTNNNTMTGIYKITTKHNDKVYIGSSNNITKRFGSHISKLNRNKHHSPYLQAVYNKYGVKNLEFSIIELTLLENKIEKEQYWMDYYKSYNRKFGYNVSTNASCNTTGEKIIFQYSLTGEFIKEWKSISEACTFLKINNISQALKGKFAKKCGNWQWKYQKYTKLDSILAVYCSYNESGNFVKQYNSLKHIKEEFKNLSKSNITRACKENKKCQGYYWKKYDNLNYNQNIEILEKKRFTKKIGKYNKQGILIETFDSLTKAAKNINVQISNLHRVVSSNNSTYKTCKGFVWKYL